MTPIPRTADPTSVSQLPLPMAISTSSAATIRPLPIAMASKRISRGFRFRFALGSQGCGVRPSCRDSDIASALPGLMVSPTASPLTGPSHPIATHHLAFVLCGTLRGDQCRFIGNSPFCRQPAPSSRDDDASVDDGLHAVTAVRLEGFGHPGKGGGDADGAGDGVL